MLVRIMACGTPACADANSASASTMKNALQCAGTYGAAVATLLHQMHACWLGLGSLSIVLGSAGGQRSI